MNLVLRALSTRQLNAGLAVLRVITGIIFVAHGAQKLFSFGISGVSGAFSGMGIPLASVMAPLVSVLEFAGGFALIAGLMTRPVSLGLAGTMLGAIIFAHLPAGFFLPNGAEFALALLGSTVLFTLVGGGEWSVDSVLSRRMVAQPAANISDSSARGQMRVA